MALMLCFYAFIMPYKIAGIIHLVKRYDNIMSNYNSLKIDTIISKLIDPFSRILFNVQICGHYSN